MKRAIIMFTALCLFSDLTAAIFGGEPYEVFDQGGMDYLVFGNSLIDDQETLYTETADRQGDTCLLESGRDISLSLLFTDAVVQKAYLIWMGAVDPEKLDAPTDNSVHLKFVREDGYILEEDIIAGDSPRMIGDTADPFGFESLRYTANISTGCSETEAGQPGAADIAYFTYRHDLSSFFRKIHEDNYAAETPLMDGEALYGTYTVSGLDCTEHDHYKCRTLMVSNWSILLLYSSGTIAGGKKIFLYPGLARLQGETLTTVFDGLDLPESPDMRFTMVTAEGDRGLVSPMLPPEMLYLQGQNGLEDYPLVDNCSSNTAEPLEIWDSYGSATYWASDGRCMSRVENPTFAYDIDLFCLNATESAHLYGSFMEESSSLGLIFSLNQDDILTNFIVFAVDIKYPSFDIPDKDELLNCVCSPEDREVYCEGEPQYVQIRVENWGEATAESVYLQSEYNSTFDYVPDTTEVATEFDDQGNGTNWQKILDGPEGAFPLSEPNLIANTLHSFQTDPSLAASYLIRFRLLPKTGLAKNCLGTLSAAISDDKNLYKTNHNIPLKLFPGVCEKTCTIEELKKKCGGLSPDDPNIFDPDKTDGDTLVDSDDLTDETPDPVPDNAIDPRATHPMSAQTPGCSLVLF